MMKWSYACMATIQIYIFTITSARYLQQEKSDSLDSELDLNSLEDYKTYIRNRVKQQQPNSLISNLSFYNLTIAQQRKTLRQYRAKLIELQELDEQREKTHQDIHIRQFSSYAMKEGERKGAFKFSVDIRQPDSYKLQTTVQSAELKLRRKTIDHSELTRQNSSNNHRNIGYNTVLLIYQTVPGDMRRLVTSQVISLVNNSTLSIDISSIVQDWIDEPLLNHGIEIECSTHDLSTIIEFPSQSDGTHLSTLDIYTYEKPINVARRKRRSLTQEELCESSRCCRKPVDIKLSDVGLHVPGIHDEGETFRAYMCEGRCTRNYKLHNYWAHVKNILRDQGNRKVRNRCVPTAFETSFRHYYYGINGVMAFTEYDDLIVRQCGCA